MYNKCCVVGCDTRRPDVPLHKFPKTEIGLQKWIECIGCESLRSLSYIQIRKKFVCRKHFERRFHTSSQANCRLRGGAFPTLFTESEIASGTPTHATTGPIRCSDHDYTQKRKLEDHTYSKDEKLDIVSDDITLPSLPEQHVSTIENPGLIETNIISSEKSSAQDRTENTLRADCISRRSKSRKRLINKVNDLSHSKKLYPLYNNSQSQLDFSQRPRSPIKLTKDKSFIKEINPITKKMVTKLNIGEGINNQIFDALKKEVSTWKESKKYCSILFDEVALEAGLNNDKHKDVTDGFFDLGEKINDFADHALVFMLRGAVATWQQPIAVYFCKGSTPGVHLRIFFKEVITAISDAGLLPIALVSDQGTAFQSAMKALQEDTRKNHLHADDVIEVNGQTMSVIYDRLHLIKGLRNNFLAKNIKYENKISKWNDIVEVYKADCSHAQMRLLHKLNDEHVIPEKIKKMEVKNCAQVFSKTMAATLSYSAQFGQYADGNVVSPTLKNTAEIVSLFDDLFDSVNGASLYSKNNKGKPLRQEICEKSTHHAFWEEAILKLSKIRFVDANGREITVPSQKNWITTLKSYKRVWQFFKTKNIKIMRPSFFNSDPIENFFGQVRAFNFRNNDPDCQIFQCTFKSLLITRFIKFHSDGFNCEEESGEQLLKLQSLFGTSCYCMHENDSSERSDSVI